MIVTITNRFINTNDSLYLIKRVLKEDEIKEGFLDELKEEFKSDVVFKQNGIYYFTKKVEDAQLLLEEELGNPQDI